MEAVVNRGWRLALAKHAFYHEVREGQPAVGIGTATRALNKRVKLQTPHADALSKQYNRPAFLNHGQALFKAYNANALELAATLRFGESMGSNGGCHRVSIANVEE